MRAEYGYTLTQGTTQSSLMVQPMTVSANVIDVDERDFSSAVLERSRDTPVVVDFWAPWCGPCRVLGPTLERLANSADGAWVLAKVNVDHNQRLAGQFGVQGIPAVKAFRDGRVVSEFTGALPERDVRAWLKQLVPSEIEQLVAQAQVLEKSDPAAAAALYRRVVQADPDHADGLLGLGRVLTLQSDPEAESVLRRIKAGTPQHVAAQSLIDLAGFLAGAPDDLAAARDHLAHDPHSSLARWQLAGALARAGQWEDALRHLLALVQRDRGFGDDGARRAMLAIFALLGERDPVAAQYRRQLASALF
jgi:putative thioredoxin